MHPQQYNNTSFINSKKIQSSPRSRQSYFQKIPELQSSIEFQKKSVPYIVKKQNQKMFSTKIQLVQMNQVKISIISKFQKLKIIVPILRQSRKEIILRHFSSQRLSWKVKLQIKRFYFGFKFMNNSQIYNLKKLQLLMQSNSKLQATILLEVNNASLDQLLSGNKGHLSSGNCKFAKLTNQQSSMIYFYVVNDVYYTLTKGTTFAKIQYPETVSYIFPHWQSGICALSFHIKSEQICKIDEILKNTVTLKTFQSAMDNPAFSKLVELNCPNVEKNEISPPGKIKLALQKTGQYIGQTLSAATQFFSDTSQKSEKTLNENYEQIQKKTQQSKQKAEKGAKEIEKITNQNWQKLKEGTGKFFQVSQEYFDKIWNSIKETTNQFTNKVQQAKQKQENPKLAKAKQIAGKSGQYVGQKIQGMKETANNATEKAKQMAGKVLGQSKQNQQNDDNKEEKKPKKTSEQNPENATLI